MSPALIMYYDDFSMESIARAEKVGFVVMKNRLFKERKKLGFKARRTFISLSQESRDFIEDKSIVIELLDSGMSICEIANKYDIHRKAATRQLAKWGREAKRTSTKIESWTLTDLYKNWVEAPSDLIVTVNKKPAFKLVRIL